MRQKMVANVGVGTDCFEMIDVYRVLLLAEVRHYITVHISHTAADDSMLGCETSVDQFMQLLPIEHQTYTSMPPRILCPHSRLGEASVEYVSKVPPAQRDGVHRKASEFRLKFELVR